LRGAIRCGQKLRYLFLAFGVLLALVSHLALLDISTGLADCRSRLMFGGIIAMIVSATR